MSLPNFSVDLLNTAIRDGSLNGENFENLMKNNEFLSSPDLYSAAVAVINSYKETKKDMPAIKRAYDILENTNVKSLPINQTGITSYFSMWGFNNAKARSQEIISTHFSDYLEAVTTQRTTGIDLEKKLVRHARQVEAFLKAFGVEENEWKELKSDLAQGKEADGVKHWNNILAQVRATSNGALKTTKDVEDFLLGHKTVQHLVNPTNPLQARLLGAYAHIDSLMNTSSLFTVRHHQGLGVSVLGSEKETLQNQENFLNIWANVQVGLLLGDHQAVENSLNTKLPRLNESINSGVAPFRSIITNLDPSIKILLHNVPITSLPKCPYSIKMERGVQLPVALDNRFYFAAAAPRSPSSSQDFLQSAAKNNVGVIVDLQGELESWDKLIPSRMGEEANGVKLLDKEDEKIPGASANSQYMTRHTVEVTLPEGKKRQFKVLRMHNWNTQESLDSAALTYVSREAAKLEQQTNGKLLVISGEGKQRTSAFLIYHHLSQKEVPSINDSLADTSNEYAHFAARGTHYDNTVKEALELNKQPVPITGADEKLMTRQGLIQNAVGRTVQIIKVIQQITLPDTFQKIMESQIDHFVSGLDEENQRLCISILADTAGLVLKSRGEPDKIRQAVLYLLNHGITYSQLEQKYKDTFPEHPSDIQSVMSSLIEPKVFKKIYPESASYPFLYGFFENKLQLEKRPSDVADVIEEIEGNIAGVSSNALLMHSELRRGLNAKLLNIESINKFVESRYAPLLSDFHRLLKNLSPLEVPSINPKVFSIAEPKAIGLTTQEHLDQMTPEQRKAESKRP
ncbi:MAG: protein-tyrosine phosphatase family protein [Parachlamydiales bacterium]|jgi:hypothetical protein